MVQSFRDLQVWQRAMQLAVSVYGWTKEFPRDELYGLTSQMRRSAVSVPSNIAEGQGRFNPGEFRQFLGVARGSNCELQTQLELARLLSFGEAKKLEESVALSHEVGKMLLALADSLVDAKR